VEAALLYVIHKGFLKVNNNQPMDLEHNQIMRCIIYCNDFIGLEILAICTKCRKGLIK
jgi:hypothetical protein